MPAIDATVSDVAPEIAEAVNVVTNPPAFADMMALPTAPTMYVPLGSAGLAAARLSLQLIELEPPYPVVPLRV
jgi:hypothetical protein